MFETTVLLPLPFSRSAIDEYEPSTEVSGVGTMASLISGRCRSERRDERLYTL
jgi:hypothetical protein